MHRKYGLLNSTYRNMLPLILEIVLSIIAYTARAATIATGFESSGGWDTDTTTVKTEETTKHIYVIDTTKSLHDDVTMDGVAQQQIESTTFEPSTKAIEGRDGSNDADNTRNLTLGNDITTTRGLTNSNESGVDVITIVGAVCGVIGLLLGIILSAGIWLYISKRRIRQRNDMAKNPVEKTFERIDFNLTLPRDQQQTHSIHESSSPSSTASSPKNPPPESSYMHFEDPVPYETDVYDSGRPHSRNPTPPREPSNHSQDDDDFQEDDERYIENQEDDAYDDHVPESFHHYEHQSRPHEPSKNVGQYRHPVVARNKRASLSSYNALLHHDSSDQSSISRMSSSVTGSGPRRSSSCTYRTDLPDSDGSNSSTCGGSISVTGSLARDKTSMPSSIYSERSHEYATSRSSYFSDSNTMSTHVTSSYTTEAPAHIPDEDFEENVDETSLSSSDLFMTGHENSIFEDDERKSTVSAKHDDDAESSLSYFDLKLPPARFGSPLRPSTCYEVDESEIDLRRNSTTSAISDEFTIKSSNSDTTINL